VYSGTAGTGSCAPTKAWTAAGDTTDFTYSLSGANFVVGAAAGVRPATVKDPQRLSTSMGYDARTWNTSTVARSGDNAQQRQYFGPFGLSDSSFDAVGIRTRILYDSSGRVTHTKTGTGSMAPTMRLTFDHSGNVIRTDVYSAVDIDLTELLGKVDSTRTYYNRLGWADSTLHPGSRTGKMARKETFKYDAYGNRIVTYPGNGSQNNVATNWRGLVTGRSLAQVGFNSFDGEPFANGDTVSRIFSASYTPYMQSVLFPADARGPGYTSSYTYDNKGHLATAVSTEGYIGKVSERRIGYSRVGQIVADTVTFRDSVRVIQNYQYNRRGQRTIASDTVIRLLGTGATNDLASWTYYTYETGNTGRLASVLRSWRADTSGTGVAGRKGYVRVSYKYGIGSRDSLRTLKMNPGWPLPTGAGDINKGDSLRTIWLYDAVGRVNSLQTKSVKSGSVLYSFAPGTTTAPGYDLGDELHGYTAQEYLGDAFLTNQTALNYSADGTRRLLSSIRTSSDGTSGINSYAYDLKGNRQTQSGVTLSVGGFACPASTVDSLSYGADDQLMRRKNAFTDCGVSGYVSDHAGNRIAQVDTTNGTPHVYSLSYYTAANQLAYSAVIVGHAADDIYDKTWHFYDAEGRRVITDVVNTLQYPGGGGGPGSGVRTMYVYDGPNVALTLHGDGAVGQRYFSSGVDENLAITGTMPQTNGVLALSATFQGSTNSAWRSDAGRELYAKYYAQDPFGSFQTASNPGNSVETGTGFAGASVPNSTAGFVYFRNRWYDPKSGRFLTQDPIGLAGGVNLYAYAGNNPISFRDPYGLCPECIIRAGLGAAEIATAVQPEGPGEAAGAVLLLGALVLAGIDAVSDEVAKPPVFHRLESSTQTPADAAKITSSGELWGKAPAGSNTPQVKAYYGTLPVGARGIEFTTAVPADPSSGHPTNARWLPGMPGVRLDGDYAKIPVTVTKNTQTP
jgi:RHS repeat-associated protein